MNTSEIKQEIVANAETLRQIHGRVHETFRHRDESAARREEWEEAAAYFNKNWDRLAFPGGYRRDEESDALLRISSGDAEAIEAAICFLEVRPYFFRSGYMFKDILRKVKKAPLSEEQAARLEAVIGKLEEWRRERRLGEIFEEG